MFKSKVFQIMIAMLIVITLILVAFLVLWNFMEKDKSDDPNVQAKASVEKVEPKKISASELKAMTVSVPEVITNLADKKIVKASFVFEMDSKKGKEEFEYLDFKVKSIINATLADMQSTQIIGSKGYDQLTTMLMNKINPILNDGKLKQIYITEMILQ